MRVRTALAPLALTTLATLAGCTSEGGAGAVPRGETELSAQAFTVSHRNKVRLPAAGTVLSATGFATQLRMRDPVGRSGAWLREVSKFLGGISWTHPVDMLRDASLPDLYHGKPNGGSARVPGRSGERFGRRRGVAGADDRAAGPRRRPVSLEDAWTPRRRRPPRRAERVGLSRAMSAAWRSARSRCTESGEAGP